MVGHNVVIGEGCELDAQCGVSGSTKIGARTWIGSQAGLVGHLEVGEGCRIEAYTGVTKKLAPNTHLKGVFPAMAPEQFDRQQELVARLPDLVERLEKLETKTAQAV
jgi:UDP-3-O-[3-hydroxymyristoyl] glucosamine N-acyltransferase